MNATNLNYTHKYNPNGPAGYFLTFHTYGTWFHGDKRGSTGRKGHNIPGTPMKSPDPALMKLQKTRLKQPPVTFNISQRKSINSTIKQVAAYNNWMLHALNVRTEHVHVVITASKLPEPIMNSLKSWCTRRMREKGLWDGKHSPWSRHGSARYLWNEKEIRNACNYVLFGQVKEPLPNGRGSACRGSAY